ncbi:MAG: spermidine/putrescine ABC transporter permease [Nisaea sp.]|jgi:spermidine/putrescine transport system permease protein|nr:spermidine/putrescine ABC transporter permease [Nisaea sp.]OUX96739.1 MAG: spermidine/putrescine ABC transporter permease [Candidatus Endolissoclinum sp. TMED26]
MEHWRKNRLLFSVLMVPPTFWLAIFFTLPLALVWVYSFGERGPQGQTILAFSLGNYARALEWIHLGILWKSIVIAAITTVICFVVGMALSLGISFAPKKWRNLLLLLVILPFWTNLLIRTYAWIAVLRTSGFVNHWLETAHSALAGILAALGLPDVLGSFEPLALLYNQRAVVIGLVYVHLPFMILPIYASMEKLDRSYLEASLDLGAGHWRTLISVLIPLTWPGIASGSLLVFILSLGTFLTPDLLGGTDSIMIGNLIAQQFGPSRDWAFGAAISFLLMYLTFIVLWLRAGYASRHDDKMVM